MTGASGIVGTFLRPLLLEEGYELVSNSRRELKELGEKETWVYGDVCDKDFVEAQVAGVDAVIHLASLVGEEYTFEQVMGPNVMGQWHILSSAHRHGKRLIYASSHHAIGFQRRDGGPYGLGAPLRGDSPYGLSKAFSELMSQYFWDRYGFPSLGLRIGSLAKEAIDERRVHTWMSPRDLLQQVEIGLHHALNGHRVLYGQSENPAPFFINDDRELDYRPADRALDNLADPGLANAGPDAEDPSSWFVGGYFALSDAEGLAKGREEKT